MTSEKLCLFIEFLPFIAVNQNHFIPNLCYWFITLSMRNYKLIIYLCRRCESNDFLSFASNKNLVLYSGAWLFRPSYRHIVPGVPIIKVYVKPFNWPELRSSRKTSKRIDKLIKLNHSMALTVLKHRMFLYTVKWNNINFISTWQGQCLSWSTCY